MGFKITADGDCSHEMKRHLLHERKAMTNLNSILKGIDITLLTKVHLVKAKTFRVVMYGCELDQKGRWALKNWCFWTVVLKKTPESSFRLMSIESVMPSSHLNHCHPLLLLPSIPPRIRVFSNESILRMRWPKYLSFSFSIIPSKEHPELISFRMDWLDLSAVQGTLKSLLQHHSPKASILWLSDFFTVQLSHS